MPRSSSDQDLPVTTQYMSDKILVGFKDPKFSTRQLDAFADRLYRQLQEIPLTTTIVFNLSNLEWIGHEELVFLSAVFHELKARERKFYLQFRSVKQISPRQAAQIGKLWDVWKIHDFVPPNDKGFYDYNSYMDISDTYVSYLRTNILKDSVTGGQMYNWYRITPFTHLKINRQINDEDQIAENLQHIYHLDIATNDLLNSYQSHTPFLNHTLSSVITKELFENSIDHAYPKAFKGTRSCYFGISLKNKRKGEPEAIEYSLQNNFEEEELPGTEAFFTNADGTFRNRSCLQFTFVDFGQGIPVSLRPAYERYLTESKNVPESGKTQKGRHIDSLILEFAFDHQSSRSLLSDKFKNKLNVPRGLFDIIDIVKRYEGLIVARSNYGKIFYDFSDPEKSIAESVGYFDDSKSFIPGTMISIYIPENKTGIKISPIRSKPFVGAKTTRTAEYVSVLQLQKKIAEEIRSVDDPQERKEALYDRTLNAIDAELNKFTGCAVTAYFDFGGCRFEERPIKYILYFLASSYKINGQVNVVVINPPDQHMVDNIRHSLLARKQAARHLIYHPVPCIYTNYETGDFEVIWIGAPNSADEKQLTECLTFLELDRWNTNLLQPDAVDGNIFSIDKQGNLVRNVPHLSELAINALILQSTSKEGDTVFLTAGNYYLYEYIGFLELLQDDKYAAFLSAHLLNYITKEDVNQLDTLITVTLSSQLLGKFLKEEILQRYGKTIGLTRLSNYHTYAEERPFQMLPPGTKAMLVCDVIATGFLIGDVGRQLERRKCQLLSVASLVDTRRNLLEQEYLKQEIKPFFTDPKVIKVISLAYRPIPKFSSNVDLCKNMIRINPVTNGPNTLSINKSENDKILIKDNRQFLNRLYDLNKDYLYVGNFEQNNVQHPYWIEVGKLMRCQDGRDMLVDLIDLLKEMETRRMSNSPGAGSAKIGQATKLLAEVRSGDLDVEANKVAYQAIDQALADLASRLAQAGAAPATFEIDMVFYPVYSGVELISKNYYRTDIFKDKDLQIVPIARINTPKGWRLTFPPKFLNRLAKDKSVLILDAGSITGDTIYQMITEICYLDVKKITVLSVIGRVEDFQREFLSRVKEMKVKKYQIQDSIIEFELEDQAEHSVPVHVYFGTHFHIPVYSGLATNNPMQKERDRLEKMLQISNLPVTVKRFIDKRLSELNPLHIDSIENYKPPGYLPEDRARTKVPVNELLYFRDQLGKISGYRFFNEYFKFFDDILQYYNDASKRKQTVTDRYQRIELIIAILIHEPPLLRVIFDLVPDLHAKLKQFIELIIVKQEISITHLYYKWNHEALLRFLFHIYKEELLYNKTDNSQSLYKTFRFAEEDFGNEAINYLSYALFNELTHFRSDLNSDPNDQRIHNRIIHLKKNNQHRLDPRSQRVLDKLESYCNSNPFAEKELDPDSKDTVGYFSHTLRKIYSNEEVNGRYHGTTEAALALIDSQIQALKSLKGAGTAARIELISNQWKDAISTLEAILKNAKGIEDLLTFYNNGKLYNLIAGNVFSLQTCVTKFDEYLYTGQLLEKVNEASDILKYLIEKIISRGSACFTFFSGYKCDLLIYYKSFALEHLIAQGFQVEHHIAQDIDGTLIDVHEEVWQKLILEPLVFNLINHASRESVSLNWEMDEHYYTFTIRSEKARAPIFDASDISQTENKGSGLDSMKKACAFYNIQLKYTDLDKPYKTFTTVLKFPKSNPS